MAAPGWYFRTDVGDQDTQGSSTSYLVTVHTNLDMYNEHGTQVDAQARKRVIRGSPRPASALVGPCKED